MPLIRYREIKLNAASLWQVNNVNKVVEYFKSLGYDLSLRQVFYQLVAKNIIKNTFRNYKNLGTLIAKGRLAGLIDWDSIDDRTRYIRQRGHYESPSQFMHGIHRAYHLDLRIDQPEYLEVWVEKDALIEVVQRAASRNDVPCFSCRGYTSQTEMWNASQRLIDQSQGGTRPVTIIHLGDHDPSGIDMTRDIEDRLTEFGAENYGIVINRIALNMNQIEEYKPPTNPAKETDVRNKRYRERFGSDSWELDALDPQVIDKLIQAEIDAHTDEDKMTAQMHKQGVHRAQIIKAENFATDPGAFIAKSDLVEIGHTDHNIQHDKSMVILDDEDKFLDVDQPVYMVRTEENEFDGTEEEWDE